MDMIDKIEKVIYKLIDLTDEDDLKVIRKELRACICILCGEREWYDRHLDLLDPDEDSHFV